MENIQSNQKNKKLETVVLGGGCFWCTEAALSRLRGVQSVVPGYCGGPGAAPTYAQVCRGDSGHIEVVRVHFDPSVISLETLLLVFFASHDPTSMDRQGADEGEQYRSVVFWQTPAQESVARAMIATFDRENTFGAPVVTQLLPAASFWEAEPEHHDYYARVPSQGYCQWVIAPKLAKLRAQFDALYR